MRLPRFVLDPLVRRRVGFEKLDLERYTIRIARTAHDYESAFRLVHASYVAMGIDDARPDGMRVIPQHVLPEATVFVAYDEARLVGTMTVIEDSNASLPLTKEYPEAIERLRASGARLVEYASLSVVRRCWHTGVTQLLNMAAYHHAYTRLDATHTVIGVHPRAADLYRAVFDFQPLGPMRPHAELGAEVVGLVQDMVAAQAFAARHFKRPMRSGRTPLEHFVHRPPACIEQPPPSLSALELARWKLPRDVFQQLFLNKADRLATLDAPTRSMLEHYRTRATLVRDAALGDVNADEPSDVPLAYDEHDKRGARQ